MTDKMTIQEAITELEECYLVQSDDEGRRRNKAVTMAIEALEKQIPKKPNTKFYEQGGVISKCPVCGDWDGDWWFNEPKHCRGCGQAIDWESDTDDNH